MVSIITGVPGSGKSFKAVNDIVSQLVNPKSDFQYLYTNIAGFDFDLMRSKLKKNRLNQKCFELKNSILNKHISAMYEIYIDESKTEEDLIEYSKKHHLYKSYIVFDEAHNFFGIPSTEKIWFLTYHRHIYLEIVLITQNIALIHRLYLKVIEVYFDAHRRSNAITNAFKYSFYTSDKFEKENRLDIIKISPDSKLFELYISGDSVKGKKVVYKFIAIIAIAVIVIGGFAITTWDSIQSKGTALTDINNISTPKPKKELIPKYSSSNYHLYFTCLNAGPGDNSYCKLEGAPIMYQYDYTFDTLSKHKYYKTYSRVQSLYLNKYGIVLYEYSIPLSFLDQYFPRWFDYIKSQQEVEKKTDPSFSEKITQSLSLNQ